MLNKVCLLGCPHTHDGILGRSELWLILNGNRLNRNIFIRLSLNIAYKIVSIRGIDARIVIVQILAIVGLPAYFIQGGAFRSHPVIFLVRIPAWTTR